MKACSRALHRAVAAGGDLGVLQGRERVDDGVVAVADAQDARGEVVLPSHHRRLAHTLYVDAAPCTWTSTALPALPS